jgi:hypothetical protein
MMKKGQSLKSTIDVATNCAQAGISVTFYAMVGFPTETREEAQATLDFLIEHADVVREVSLQTFHIDEVAQTYREPEAFGIKILDDPSADIELYHDYECERGMTQAEAAEMFERMMAGLSRHYPLFAGDNIYYFMQKSHYFLHLARDVAPEVFVERCRKRTLAREQRGFDPALAAREHVSFTDLPFSYTQAAAKLAHPLARAVRPDFLTGRYVEGAEAAAERALGAICAARRVLCYDGDEAEFVELRPDGRRLYEWIAARGSTGELIDEIESTEGRARVREFARELHKLGLLAPRASTLVTT